MAKLGTTSKLNVRGDLCIIRRKSSDKTVLSVWEKKNVITFAGVESIVKLMAPNAVFGITVQEENQIGSMRFGTNSTTPERTDLNLAAEAIVAGDPVRIALPDASRIVGAAGTVEFVALLDSSTGNGITYREAGLFTRGTDTDPLLTTPDPTTMFSRQVFPDQVKTGAVELEFRWRLTFTV